MSLSISPYEIIPPNDRWVPSSALNEKDKRQLLPPLVKKIRQEVFEWRKNNYPGISKTSKALIHWWFLKQHEKFRYYFAQREAIESIIYLYEVANIRDKKELYKKYLLGLLGLKRN